MCTKNKKGFTLVELLIIVAIIAVLVAISIPIFSSQLEKSRRAVDLANVRSAKASAAAEYMNNGESGSVSYVYNGGSVTKIDLTNSMDLDKKVSESGYGKSTKEDTDGSITGATGIPKDSVVEVTINGSDISSRWIQGLWSYDKETKTLTFSDFTIRVPVILLTPKSRTTTSGFQAIVIDSMCSKEVSSVERLYHHAECCRQRCSTRIQSSYRGDCERDRRRCGMNACIALLLCVEQRLSSLSGVGQLPIDTAIPQLRTHAERTTQNG